MTSLRSLAERDLRVTLERDGDRVNLIDPDGVRYETTVDGRPLQGQVLYDVSRINPENAERMTVDMPVVTLRRSSLVRVPRAGETWIVEIPESPVPGAAMVPFCLSPVRPPEGGASLGFIRLYLQTVEQSI